ncbi:restriction endonuclease subunit S [Klebsiella michiganensis]|uniref:restriction endonuclease subunit S n=1 Tax=Klebsiella michiganensis TaxID=1134687 RepID=UPI0022472E84|nr:restriction endonuclease subunit S [Klebsiella michiganensis]MCW9450609.1 restriction endonuclease subunit S [Klebsiella michiganensis]
MSGGKLPEGWQTSSIGDLCKKVTDGSHNPPRASETGLPMLSAKNINNGSIVFSETHRIISEAEFWEENKRTSIESGDVLLTIVGTLGRTAVVPQDFTPFTLQRSVAVLSTSELEPSYFRYALENREFQIQIHENSKGTAQKGIYLNALKKLTINIAPKNEQKIIAEKLDTLLAQVDSTKARLEQIPQILKRFRQAVLSAAVGGKFTTDTGFIQSPLTIGLETSFSPKGWQWYKLTELAQLESGHTPRKTISEYWDNGDIPWISLQDIRAAHGKVIYKTKFMPTQKGIDNSSARLLPEGTVCFSRDISVGYTTIMGTSMATTQHFANWICGKKLNNKYLMFSFMAAKQHLTKSGQGTTVKTIYMPALKELQILIPPLPEQHEIVLRVEQLFAYADSIEKQVNSALARVNSLTQSILAKAFRGELTAQWRAENPDLISGENSAAALLEKIKAERTASGSKKTTRKKA